MPVRSAFSGPRQTARPNGNRDHTVRQVYRGSELASNEWRGRLYEGENCYTPASGESRERGRGARWERALWRVIGRLGVPGVAHGMEPGAVGCRGKPSALGSTARDWAHIA